MTDWCERFSAGGKCSGGRLVFTAASAAYLNEVRGKAMADTWYTDITHFLDENGEMVKEPKEARKIGEYFASIVVMASFPEPDYPPEFRVLCRRRPNRKPCLTEIAGWLDPETDDVVWICPVCQDKGIISNWKGTLWDMSGADEIAH